MGKEWCKASLRVSNCLRGEHKTALQEQLGQITQTQLPDSEHALLKQAFQHAEHCLTEANALVDYLDQAIADLQEEEPELREAVTQSFIKADQFIDHCGEIVNDLLELRLKYRAAHSTSGLPPEVEALTETLARIELRRRSGRRSQE